MGNTGTLLGNDERVRSKPSKEWLDTLYSSINTYPEATVAALHRAGVDILAGTDSSVAQLHLDDLAHGPCNTVSYQCL